MSTEKRIGDTITAACGHIYEVRTRTWANEAPEAIVIEGYACALDFDPGTVAGRAELQKLRTNLANALIEHDIAIERIYGSLKIGDDTAHLRLAGENDAQCTQPIGQHQCHRVEHDDDHHVAVKDYEVIAVSHPSS